MVIIVLLPDSIILGTSDNALFLQLALKIVHCIDHQFGFLDLLKVVL